jgi:hypothetical protein
LPPILKLIDSHHLLRSVNHCARVFLPGPEPPLLPQHSRRCAVGQSFVRSQANRRTSRRAARFHTAMALCPARHRHRRIDGICPKPLSTSATLSPVMKSYHFASFWRGRFPIECDEELRLARTAGQRAERCRRGTCAAIDLRQPDRWRGRCLRAQSDRLSPCCAG